jgi:hypothetical protein
MSDYSHSGWIYAYPPERLSGFGGVEELEAAFTRGRLGQTVVNPLVIVSGSLAVTAR